MLRVLFICGGYSSGVEGAFNRRLSKELLRLNFQLDFVFLREKRTLMLEKAVVPHRIIQFRIPDSKSSSKLSRGIQRLSGPIQRFLLPPSDLKYLEDAVLELHKAQQYQILVSRYLPPESAYLGFHFKRVLNIPWVALFFDQFPAHVHPDIAGYNKTKRFITPLSRRRWEKYANMIYRSADSIIFPSRPLYEYVFSHLGLVDSRIKEKVSVIEHLGINPDTVEMDIPEHTSEFRLLHLGSTLWGRDPRGLIKAWQSFVNDLSPENAQVCRLEFIGPMDKGILEDLAQNHIHKSISISANGIPADEALRKLLDSTSSILLDAYAKPNIFVAGKLAECYSLGKPILVLSPEGSASRQLLAGDPFSYFAEPGDVLTIESQIRELYNRWKSSDDFLPRNVMAHRKPLFDPKVVADKYYGIFTDLVGK